MTELWCTRKQNTRDTCKGRCSVQILVKQLAILIHQTETTFFFFKFFQTNSNTSILPWYLSLRFVPRYIPPAISRQFTRIPFRIKRIANNHTSVHDGAMVFLPNITQQYIAATVLFPQLSCFFFSCKANASLKPAKTGHGPHSCKIFVLFYVLFVLCRSVCCVCV